MLVLNSYQPARLGRDQVTHSGLEPLVTQPLPCLLWSADSADALPMSSQVTRLELLCFNYIVMSCQTLFQLYEIQMISYNHTWRTRQTLPTSLEAPKFLEPKNLQKLVESDDSILIHPAEAETRPPQRYDDCITGSENCRGHFFNDNYYQFPPPPRRRKAQNHDDFVEN